MRIRDVESNANDLDVICAVVGPGRVHKDTADLDVRVFSRLIGVFGVFGVLSC
jgi:hypothetical protein